MTIRCADPSCRRTFLTEKALVDHAAAVHFGDIQAVVQEAIRETWSEAIVIDLSQTEVVFNAEADAEGFSYCYFRCTYELSDSNEVTLGEPAQVIRIITYEDKPGGCMPLAAGAHREEPEGGLIDMED